MRLFIAFELADKPYFQDLQKRLATKAATLTMVKDYHLTLKFLGDIPEEAVTKIKVQLDKLDFEHFQISTNPLGVFPDQESPKVIWVGLQPEQKIAQLQKKVDDALKPLFPPEKAFKPHITLARVKDIESARDLNEKVASTKVIQKIFDVRSIKLVHSVLLPTGPIYETLFEKPLK